MRKKRLRYIILSAIAGSVLLTPAMAHNYDSYITNPREPVTYIVDGKANTMQLAKLSKTDPYEDYDGKHAFTSTNIEDRFESRGAVTRYTRPNSEDADGAMSVNPMSVQSINHPNDKVTWGPDAGDSDKDAEFNYVALQNGTTETVYVVNHPMSGHGNARLNVLEMFSGDNLHEIAAVNNAVNAMQNRVILRNVGRLRDVIGAGLSHNVDGSAIDNDVFVAGGRDIEVIYGARAENRFAPTGSLKNNLVTLGAGKVVTAFGAYATNNNEEDSFFQGKVAPFNNREVIGNIVQLGANPDDKFQTEGRAPATIGQMVGGFSWTNKANKNTVIIGEGTIDGLGMFKVKNEQSKHSLKGVDTNGIYTDEVSYDVGDKSGYKYFRQPGNYYIIGGMSDVEATGNTVDINKAEPFANKQVGIWGGHYILDGSTGDIKSGNTLNVNKVKGITLSHLANFENYNFDLPENTVNGDTILTVTDPHGTDVSNTKINVGVSGAAPALHNGDSIKLIYNSNGVNTTGVQYGKLQQGVSLSYDITAKAGTDKKSVVAVVGKNTSGRPATTSTDEVTTNSLSSYTSYLVNTATSSSQPITLNVATAYRDANGKMVFTTDDIGSRIQSRGEETKYERPKNGAGSISVNPMHEFDTNATRTETRFESWGPEFVNARGGNSAKNNYLALQGGGSNYLNSGEVFHGTSAEVFTANVDGSGHAIGNVLEMFDSSYNEASGAALVTGSGNAIKNQVVIRTEGMLTGDVVGAALIKSENDDSSNEPTGNAIDNEVLSVGDPKADALYGAISVNKNAKGVLKNNKVMLLGGSVIMATGAKATVLDEDKTIFQGKRSELRSKEVEGNLVQLGDKLNPKPQAEGKEDPTVGQIIGGFSATNKANKNKVIINDGAIKGIGIFKVKNEQSNHNINGVDANGIYTDEITNGNDNTVYKYYHQSGNYYIIGGMSDVEATGNTVDINKAEPFANKQVGIWGGHYILDGSTGDIKSGNTLNVNKVKGITLSHLANFENYNFDLPENAVNGDTILTVTDPHGTDVSNTKINVGVSGAAPALHNGDSINLIYNSNGVNTTGVQYGKLQQGVSLSYDITAKAGDDNKSVVAVVKNYSEETTTPEKPVTPSTGDTTKPVTPVTPVTPSTGDATKPVTPVTPSTGDTTKPVTPVAPSTGDATKPVTPVAPSIGDTTKPVTPVTPSTGDTTKPVTPVTPSTGDATKPVVPSTGDTTKPVTPVAPSTGDTTKPVTPVTPSTGDTTKPVTPVTPSTGDATKPVAPSTGDTTKPVTPVTPNTGDTTKPVTPVTPSTGDATKPVTPVTPVTPEKPSTGNVSVKVLPQTKSLVETRTAVSGFINNGQDSITKAFANHTGDTSPIIAGINHDRMKMETGSYANIKGSHVVLGLSKQSGRTYWGPFLEMGWARYDSHLDSGLRAEGNAKYYGVGMYAKTTLDNGVYVESSVRGGRTNYTYESNELVTASSNVHASYDAHNSYYGAHLGLGKVVSYGNHLEGNVYANVFYSHQGEANATLTGKGLGETYAFDSVNSVRTRLGYKVSKHMSNHNTWYLGVAYEREFSGEAHATVKGLSTLATSLGGSSGLVEAGYTYGSNKDAFSATLNVEGWFGQKRGATLGGSINWKY